MSISLAATVDVKALEERYPGVLRASWRAHLAMPMLIGLLLALAAGSLVAIDFSWSRFSGGFGKLAHIVSLMWPPEFGTPRHLLLWTKALAETLAIAFLGTLGAATLALPFGFLAARNVMPSWVFRFSIRRGLDTMRGVDTLIWALIWINVVGLGPFAGALAIMTSDFGTFGKLFSEAIEATDPRDGEGVASSGGGGLHKIRFGLLPQVLPVLLSQVLYYFESNTRSATIIGIVGAGGIGLHLSEAIRTLEWRQVSFLVLMILCAVAVIDFVSSRLRFAIIGGNRSPGR